MIRSNSYSNKQKRYCSMQQLVESPKHYMKWNTAEERNTYCTISFLWSSRTVIGGRGGLRKGLKGTEKVGVFLFGRWEHCRGAFIKPVSCSIWDLCISLCIHFWGWIIKMYFFYCGKTDLAHHLTFLSVFKRTEAFSTFSLFCASTALCVRFASLRKANWKHGRMWGPV